MKPAAEQMCQIPLTRGSEERLTLGRGEERRPKETGKRNSMIKRTKKKKKHKNGSVAITIGKLKGN